MIRFSQIVEPPGAHFGNGETPQPQLRCAWPNTRFLTTWLLDSPREPVWEAIYDQARWPSWWRGVEEARSSTARRRAAASAPSRGMVWKSLLPYRVEFEVTTTQVERPHLLEADAVGELTGVGRWRLYEQDGVDRGPLRVERARRRRPG